MSISSHSFRLAMDLASFKKETGLARKEYFELSRAVKGLESPLQKQEALFDKATIAFNKGALSQQHYAQMQRNLIRSKREAIPVIGNLFKLLHNHPWGVVAGGIVAATVALRRWSGVIQGVMRDVDQLNILAQRMSVSLQDMGGIERAAAVADMGLQQLSNAMMRFQRVGEQTGQGITQSFTNAINELREMESAQQRSIRANELFGTSWREVSAIINMGEEDYRNWVNTLNTQTFGDLGLPAIQQANEALKLYNLTMSDLRRMIVAELLPSITSMVQEFRAWVSDADNIQTVRNWIREVVDVTTLLLVPVRAAANMFNNMYQVLKSLDPQLVTYTAAIGVASVGSMALKGSVLMLSGAYAKLTRSQVINTAVTSDNADAALEAMQKVSAAYATGDAAATKSAAVTAKGAVAKMKWFEFYNYQTQKKLTADAKDKASMLKMMAIQAKQNATKLRTIALAKVEAATLETSRFLRERDIYLKMKAQTVELASQRLMMATFGTRKQFLAADAAATKANTELHRQATKVRSAKFVATTQLTIAEQALTKATVANTAATKATMAADQAAMATKFKLLGVIKIAAATSVAWIGKIIAGITMWKVAIAAAVVYAGVKLGEWLHSWSDAAQGSARVMKELTDQFQHMRAAQSAEGVGWFTDAAASELDQYINKTKELITQTEAHNEQLIATQSWWNFWQRNKQGVEANNEAIETYRALIQQAEMAKMGAGLTPNEEATRAVTELYTQLRLQHDRIGLTEQEIQINELRAKGVEEQDVQRIIAQQRLNATKQREIDLETERVAKIQRARDEEIQRVQDLNNNVRTLADNLREQALIARMGWDADQIERYRLSLQGLDDEQIKFIKNLQDQRNAAENFRDLTKSISDGLEALETKYSPQLTDEQRLDQQFQQYLTHLTDVEKAQAEHWYRQQRIRLQGLAAEQRDQEKAQQIIQSLPAATIKPQDEFRKNIAELNRLRGDDLLSQQQYVAATQEERRKLLEAMQPPSTTELRGPGGTRATLHSRPTTMQDLFSKPEQVQPRREPYAGMLRPMDQPHQHQPIRTQQPLPNMRDVVRSVSAPPPVRESKTDQALEKNTDEMVTTLHQIRDKPPIQVQVVNIG